VSGHEKNLARTFAKGHLSQLIAFQRHRGAEEEEVQRLKSYHNKIWYQIRKDEQTRRTFSFFGVDMDEAKKLKVEIDGTGARSIRQDRKSRERSKSLEPRSSSTAPRGRNDRKEEPRDKKRSKSEVRPQDREERSTREKQDRAEDKEMEEKKEKKPKKDYEAIWRARDEKEKMKLNDTRNKSKMVEYRRKDERKDSKIARGKKDDKFKPYRKYESSRRKPCDKSARVEHRRIDTNLCRGAARAVPNN